LNCRIIILGSGSEATLSKDYQEDIKAGKAEKRASPATLIIHDDLKLLFDAGPDIKEQLAKTRHKPDAVFITHAHPDHIDGIDDLPQDTKRFLKEGAELDHTKTIAFPVKHSIIAPAVGFKFFSDHLRIIYLPDYLEIIDKKILRDTDLAILDGSVFKRDIIRNKELGIGHRSIMNSVSDMRKAGIKNMIFTHVGVVGARHDWLAEQVAKLAEPGETIILAKDSMEFELTKRGLELLESSNLQETESPARGLYLTSPHAKMIGTGEKTLLVKTIAFETGIRIPVFVLSVEKDNKPGQASVWAKVVLSEPKPISVTEFWRRQKEHRISREEFKDWGWEGKDLYAYDIQLLEKYDPPLIVKYPPGVQHWIEKLEFIGKKPKELEVEAIVPDVFEPLISPAMTKRLIRPYGVPPEEKKKWLKHLKIIRLRELELERFRHEGIDEDLANPRERWPELNADHRYLHIGYARIRTGKPWGEWTLDDIVRYHAAIVDIMRKHYFPYEVETKKGLKRELDLKSRRYEKTNPPKTDEERREWDRKREELFKQNKLLRRAAREDLTEDKQLEAVLPADFIRQITPEFLVELEDGALLDLHSDLHSSLDPKTGQADENLVNAHAYLLDELEKRGIEHPRIGDDLDLETERPIGQEIPLETTIERLVPFVVTQRAINLCGSHVYGLVEKPKDVDILVRRSGDVAQIQEIMQSWWPDKIVHAFAELKGPNWDFIPLGDFVLIPKEVFTEEPEEPQEITFGEGVPEEAKRILREVKPIVIRPDYLRIQIRDGKVIITRDEIESDPGTILKILRIFPEAQIVSGGIEPGTGHADLVFKPYKHFEKVIINEPDFKAYYGAKTVET